MTYATDEFALPLPITRAAQQTAQTFANQLPTAKADQVRLNTLAVLAVQDYFQLMEIPTDLTASDSQNPVLRLCEDVADLHVAGLGRLECRPVLPDENVCLVPPETWEDRIGYVVVQINEAEHEAVLLGFVPAVNGEELLLSELRSPEDLLDHLYELKTSKTRVQEPDEAIAKSFASAGQTLTRLGQWLTGEIDKSWQAIDQLINPAQLSAAFRRPAERGTLSSNQPNVIRATSLDLRPDLADPILLVVQVKPQANQQLEIAIVLFSSTDQPLPKGMSFSTLIANGETLTGPPHKPFLLEGCNPGDQFSIQITLNDTVVSQSFVV
jgi:Protein of unknown function (DUF1822)